MNRKSVLLTLALAVLLIGGGILSFVEHGSESACTGEALAEKDESSVVRGSESACTEEALACTEEDAEEPMTPEEKAAAEAEAKVEDFDGLTDKWMEPAKTVTMKDVDDFVKTFRKVPEDRRDECVHRALNLIPDENVMLLAGILMDKTMDRETVEAVFNDILNRDESVKKPILKEIYKDKSHPCREDVVWIFEATGEKTE